LSKYRSYTPCPTCAGARLKTESLLWRIGRKEDADAVLEPGKRFMPEGVQWSREQLEALPGLCLHDLMLLPIDRLRQFFARMQLPVGDNAKGAGEAQAKTGEAQALDCCTKKSPPASSTCATWALATSRSTGKAAR
jgi:excinuclease ABC subunit A